ncbi:MAG: VOC family protein [bacterium]
MAKITGIGGIFFKTKTDAKALAQWYETHLGLRLEPWGGAILRWRDDPHAESGLTVWNVADKDSQWLRPSDSGFMINYRVDNMDAMLAQLASGGISPVQGPELHENGRFAWILDPDGNKLELWEPTAASGESKD